MPPLLCASIWWLAEKLTPVAFQLVLGTPMILVVAGSRLHNTDLSRAVQCAPKPLIQAKTGKLISDVRHIPENYPNAADGYNGGMLRKPTSVAATPPHLGGRPPLHGFLLFVAGEHRSFETRTELTDPNRK